MAHQGSFTQQARSFERLCTQQKLSRRAVLRNIAAFTLLEGCFIPFITSCGTAPVPSHNPGTTTYTYRGHSDHVNAVAWSPHGQRIASGASDKTVQVWDASTGNHVFIYRGHSDIVYAVAWSPDGQHIASGSGQLGSTTDNTIQVWNAATGTHVFTYRGHSDGVTAVAWSPDGQHIASGSYDQTVQVWQVR